MCKKHVKDKTIPYYDWEEGTWKVVTERGEAEGDVLYVASEFIFDGILYPFHSQPPREGYRHEHAHEFSEVVEFLLDRPEYFSIVGFEEYYSLQERNMLNKLRVKLGILGEGI